MAETAEQARLLREMHLYSAGAYERMLNWPNPPRMSREEIRRRMEACRAAADKLGG